VKLVIPLKYLPVPKSLFDLAWAIIGWHLGKTFSNLDEELLKTIPDSQWYKRVIYRILYFIHHYWVGLLLIVYCGYILEVNNCWDAVFGYFGAIRALLWLGYGLFVEDGWHHVVEAIKARLKLGGD